MLARGVIGWIHLFGAVNFELFGRLNTLVEARETYFALQSRPWRSQPQCSQPLPQDEPA
ncbi:hypothetical protein MXD62_07545 [Frankia sp. Mgl5]|uniref:hypothetical protein n=1 Tax=Frankia sp. Mgl5 TaxID=2933793 RepID=UPI00200C9EEC|nr:hypothetical protein [Frankia sp. Mgl5]MCK9927020.1 hypothetical protein [Frankia sp. Mgl5]